MEVHADRIAHPAGEDSGLAAAAGVEPQDRPLEPGGRADVARRPDGDIKAAVGSERGVAPAMRALVGKAVEDDRGPGAGQGFQIARREADDAVLFGHVKGAVAIGDAVGDVEAREHLHGPVRRPVAVGINDGVNGIAPGSDEYRVQVVGHGQRPGAGNPGENRDHEPGRQVDQVKIGPDVGRRRATAQGGGDKRRYGRPKQRSEDAGFHAGFSH